MTTDSRLTALAARITAESPIESAATRHLPSRDSTTSRTTR